MTPLITLFAACAAQPPVVQDIDLRLSVPQPTYQVGDVVDVTLTAYADTRRDFAGFSAVFSWPADKIELISDSYHGPYRWGVAEWTLDAGLDGFNDTWADGDATWWALTNMDRRPGCIPTHIDPECVDYPQTGPHGLVLLVLQFRVVGEGAATIWLGKTGTFAKTAAYDHEKGGLEITRQLRSVTVQCVAPAVVPVYDPADLDRDGDVDLRDFAAFQNAFTKGTDR